MMVVDMMMMVPMLKIMMVLASSRTPTQWSWPVSKMVVVDDEDGGADGIHPKYLRNEYL